MVTARHTHLSGKRKIIEDDSLITTAEKLWGIREVEAKTRESRAKKRKVGKQKSREVRDMSTEESEMESDGVEDVLNEIMDCITVER